MAPAARIRVRERRRTMKYFLCATAASTRKGKRGKGVPAALDKYHPDSEVAN